MTTTTAITSKTMTTTKLNNTINYLKSLEIVDYEIDINFKKDIQKQNLKLLIILI